MSDRTCIASWIVLDDPRFATAFPSVGTSSADPAFQLVYWRCIAVFFLTSRIHNPSRRHLLFSNTDIAQTAPPEIVAFLGIIGVEFHTVAITRRLPLGSVGSWGNQFYVLDIIEHFAGHDFGDGLVLTDSDCVWRKSLDTFEQSIFEHGCLLYTLRKGDQKNYEAGNLLNGMSHARMTEIANRLFPSRVAAPVRYHGGEFFGATKSYCMQILPYINPLWTIAYAEADQRDSIKEEAQFLSVIADGSSKAPYTASKVIRRMWTNFEDFNIKPTDIDLVLWHLPAEKRFGFRRLWEHLNERGQDALSLSPTQINQATAHYMGVPRRGFRKLTLDLTAKIMERAHRFSPKQLALAVRRSSHES